MSKNWGGVHKNGAYQRVRRPISRRMVFVRYNECLSDSFSTVKRVVLGVLLTPTVVWDALRLSKKMHTSLLLVCEDCLAFTYFVRHISCCYAADSAQIV